MGEDLGNCKSKDISINVFESIQIDLKPVKSKKRRRVDDYDYNDPFLESFEGELDAVELECKLENFFVHKGAMEDDPKSIVRRYNNSMKKKKLVDVLSDMDQRAEASGLVTLFEFEKMLAGAFNPSSKYKKESKLESSLMWTVFMERPKNDIDHYLKYKLLSLYDSRRYSSALRQVDPRELEGELRTLKDRIESIFKGFLVAASDDKNFSSDKRFFNKFKEDEFTATMVDFCVEYMKYYAATTNECLQHIKNRALEYLNVMLPDQCTNKIRLKHYLLKSIHNRAESCDYSLEDFINNASARLDEQSQLTGDEDASLKNMIADGDQICPSFPRSSLSYSLGESREPDLIRKPLQAPYAQPVNPRSGDAFIKPSTSDGASDRENQGIIGGCPRSSLASSDMLASDEQFCTSAGCRGKDGAMSADLLCSPEGSIPGSRSSSSDGYAHEASMGLPQNTGPCSMPKESGLEAQEHLRTGLAINPERKRKQKAKFKRGND